MVRILGETVRKGSKSHRILLAERRHFLRRQRDPNSSYYGVPISELLKSNRRRKKMKFSDQRIRKLVNDYPDNLTRAMSSIALDYDIPYNRVYRAVYRKIPLRTARAMVRAGLPLSRSELRGNPFGEQLLDDLLRLKRGAARGYAFTKKFSSKQPQALDMLISKLSILKGNRDENLVTFFIRKRPKHSRDYIVILKHRKYVNGARVYSAGLKAEGAIGQFATILGAKAKRVGQSDYVFTTYGIRFPEERRKSSPGKLFGNRKR